MSTSGTQTTTFTVVDIRKVVDCFAADFSMKSQATGTRTREQVATTVADLKVLAEKKYLLGITLILKNAAGKQIRGTKYTVSENASDWVSSSPGNNLWPRTPDGTLHVIATLSSAWWSMSESTKDAFVSSNDMHSRWSLTSEDTSLSGLSSSQGQRYVSNGYGMERTNYQ